MCEVSPPPPPLMPLPPWPLTAVAMRAVAAPEGLSASQPKAPQSKAAGRNMIAAGAILVSIAISLAFRAWRMKHPVDVFPRIPAFEAWRLERPIHLFSRIPSFEAWRLRRPNQLFSRIPSFGTWRLRRPNHLFSKIPDAPMPLPKAAIFIDDVDI